MIIRTFLNCDKGPSIEIPPDVWPENVEHLHGPIKTELIRDENDNIREHHFYWIPVCPAHLIGDLKPYVGSIKPLIVNEGS